MSTVMQVAVVAGLAILIGAVAAAATVFLVGRLEDVDAGVAAGAVTALAIVAGDKS